MSALLITALVIVVVIIGLMIALHITVKLLKKSKLEVSQLTAAYHAVSQRMAALQEANIHNERIKEDANAEKQELAATADDGLITRANSLFGGGMQNDENNAGGN